MEQLSLLEFNYLRRPFYGLTKEVLGRANVSAFNYDADELERDTHNA